MSDQPIPLNRPSLAANAKRYAIESLESGLIGADGPFTQRCQGLLEEALGVPRALLTTSCTDALEMSGVLLNVGAEDEVIVPSFTFPSTANAFALRGARPVFIDIRPDTLNLAAEQLPKLINRRTRAIVPVHYGGVGCDMDAIIDIARDYGIAVVEDNAHGLFGRYRQRPLGTFGRFAALSFHETKNLTCGEGGALLINDPEYIERAESIREKGTDRSRFLRGEVEKYTWVDIGSSHAPADILAAVLLAQLEDVARIQSNRQRIWNEYHQRLRDWSAKHGIGLPEVPETCEQTYHLFYLLLQSEGQRDRFVEHMASRGISTAFHFLPLHLSEMGKRFGGRAGDCPVTEDVSSRLVRLPLYAGLKPHDVVRVIEAVEAFQSNHRQ